jgi:hypothetical protein
MGGAKLPCQNCVNPREFASFPQRFLWSLARCRARPLAIVVAGARLPKGGARRSSRAVGRLNQLLSSTGRVYTTHVSVCIVRISVSTVRILSVCILHMSVYTTHIFCGGVVVKKRSCSRLVVSACVCPHCGEAKPLTADHWDVDKRNVGRGGLRTFKCRACRRLKHAPSCINADVVSPEAEPAERDAKRHEVEPAVPPIKQLNLCSCGSYPRANGSDRCLRCLRGS